MAREILVLERSESGKQASLIFKYPILLADRKTYVDANSVTQTVVWTPSAGLPAVAQEIYTPAELAEFDNGEAFWKSVTFNIDGLTAPTAAAKAQAIYAELEAGFRAQYARVYSHIGTFINAA